MDTGFLFSTIKSYCGQSAPYMTSLCCAPQQPQSQCHVRGVLLKQRSEEELGMTEKKRKRNAPELERAMPFGCRVHPGIVCWHMVVYGGMHQSTLGKSLEEVVIKMARPTGRAGSGTERAE